MKKKTLITLLLAAFAIAGITALLLPLVLSLRDEAVRARLAESISELGALGIAAMLLLQLLQIIVAIIPGEPIELLIGLMYGTLGGLILSLAGCLIGQAIVFIAVRRFGIGFAKRFVDTDAFARLGFLRSPAKRDALIFLLFLIPGTPKDVLTYFAPFTGIKLPKFLILATLARVPSIVSSTLVGATVGDGRILESALIFGATALVGALGILINSKLTNKLQNERKTDENDCNSTENRDRPAV